VRSVDEVGADERAASLAKRSIKKASKLWALDLAIRCMDLTTLEGSDTPGKVAGLCAKRFAPSPRLFVHRSRRSVSIRARRGRREHLKGSGSRLVGGHSLSFGPELHLDKSGGDEDTVAAALKKLTW